MQAYLIAEISITHPAKYEDYRAKVRPTFVKYGGRLLTKLGSHKMPEEGNWKPDHVVVLEFPDLDSLNAWYKSPEYQPLITLLKECTGDRSTLFFLEGV